MNVNTLFIPLIFLPAIASATPYLGAEFGAGTIGSSVSTVYAADSGKNYQYDKSEIFGAFAGYQFDSGRTDSLGIELGYRNYSSDDVVLDGQAQTKMDASQFSLKPVYFYNLNKKITLKTSVGLTHTHYKFNAHYDKASETRTYNVYGAIASVGADAVVTKNVTIGTSISYQMDEIAHATTFMINSTYRF